MPFFGGGGSSGGSGGSGSQTTYPVLSGSGAPGASLGSNGQIYIDTSTDTLYGPKTGGSWGSGIVLTGADYSDITNLPTTFTPATHTHVIGDVTDLQTELDGKAASTHSHAIADVTNLQTELDGKAASTHSHEVADVTNLQTLLDAKATQTFVNDEITALVDGAPIELNTLNKIAESLNDNDEFYGYVTDQLALKSDTTHNHRLEQLSNVSGTPIDGHILRYDGDQWELTTQADPANTLAGLTDVSNVSPTDGYFLKYSGGEWSPGAAVIDLSSEVGNLVASPANGVLEIRGDATTNTSGSLQLNCESNSHAIVIEGPPHSAAASYTLTLPDDAGSAGQVLQTDGSGALSWLTVGGSGNSVSFSSVPATETSTGSVGEMALDAVHLYVCVSQDYWKRIPLESFSGATGGGGGGNVTGIFITEQPVGGSVVNGNFTLSLNATVPSGTINYQWQKFGGSGSSSGSSSINQVTHPGAVFEGEDSGDFFGWKLEQSGDGNTIIASGYLNDDSGSNMGMARVLRWNGTAWAQIGGDINTPNTTTAGPYFGGSVAISHDGNTIAIAGGTTVSVYDWNSSTSAWDIQTPLIGVPADPNPWGYTNTGVDKKPHGVSLNEDGTRLAICRPNYVIDGTQNQTGAVFIYDRASTSVAFGDVEDSYFPLTGDVVSSQTKYYTAVSLSKDGNKIACGGWEWDNSAGVQQVGGIDVFEWDSTTSSWSQMGSTIYGDSVNDRLTNIFYDPPGATNSALAISDDGTHVIAGARNAAGNSAGTNSGYAAVWSYNGSSWSMKGSEFRGDQAEDQRLGTDVDISSDGSRIVITSDGLDARSNTNPVIAYRYPKIEVYDWNSSTSSWDEVGTIYAPDADSTGQIPQYVQYNSYAKNACAFGAVASLSSDGLKLIASAPGNALTAAGRLLEYELTSAGSGSGSGSGSSSSWSDISGAVYSTLELTALDASNDGDQYRCYLTSTGHSDVISNTAILSVPATGVAGVSSTKPGIFFDRNWSDTYKVGLWRGTGKNWNYESAGWSLIEEETEWEFDSLNQGDWTITKRGSSSLPTRGGNVWRYGLMDVPPQENPGLAQNYRYSSQVAGQYVTVVDNSGNSGYNNEDELITQLDMNSWTYWSNPTTQSGKWNRAARFRTRVVIERFQNNQEQQATTEWSEWSDWCADPGGKQFTNQNTIFVNNPAEGTTSATTVELLPTSANQNDHVEFYADIAGTNKRYLWKYNDTYDVTKWTGFTLSNTNNADSRIARLKTYFLTTADVGTRYLRCLGAADWNKATLSQPATILVRDTNDGETYPLAVSSMSGKSVTQYWSASGQQKYGTQFYCPKLIISKRDPDNSSDPNASEELDFTGFYGATPSETKNYIKNGQIVYWYEYANSYGSNYGNLFYYHSTDTVNINSTGDFELPHWNTGYQQIRWRWRFVGVDITLGNVVHSSITTVWSPWEYHN